MAGKKVPYRNPEGYADPTAYGALNNVLYTVGGTTMKVKLDIGAKLPTRAFKTDAGLDLYAMQDGIVRAGQAATFHTGVHIQLPEGTAGVMLPKSGLMTRRNLLAFGVIDEGYVGEVIVHVFNLGKDDYTFRAGDKLTQLLVIPVLYEPVEIVDKLDSGERGMNGFGSSGR